MKKKIITVLSLVTIVALLASLLCGCNATPAKIFKDTPNEFYPTELKPIDSLNGVSVVSTRGGLVRFSRTDALGATYNGVYSLIAGKTVCEPTLNTIDITLANGDVFSVLDFVDNTISYYDSFGTALVTDVDSATATDITSDYAVIGNSAFILEDGKWDGNRITKGFGWDDDVTQSTGASNNYYYALVGNVVKIFDRKSLDLAAVLNINEYAYESTSAQQAFFFTEDEIVLQYVDDLAADATEYDLMLTGKKVNLRHYIYNVKNGKIKEVKNYGYYILFAGAAQNGISSFNDNVSDIMYAYEVKDKVASRDAKAFAVKKNLKVQYAFDDITYGMMRADKFGEGYVVTRGDGSQAIVNKQGKAVAEIGDATVYGDYLFMGDSVYTLKHNKMVKEAQIDSQKYAIANITDGYMLLTSTDDGSTYGAKVGSEPAKIGDTVQLFTASKLYTVTDNFGIVTVYSFAGKKLGEGYTSFGVVKSVSCSDGSVKTLACVDGTKYVQFE